MALILKLFFSIESTIYRPSVLSNKGGCLEKADVG